MIHPDTELKRRGDTIGLGLFATAPIPKGTVIWMRDPIDQVRSPAEVAKLPPALRALYALYSYVDIDGSWVLCWDHGRYINHACAPSLVGVGTVMEVAQADVAPGQELTCEYNFECLVVGFACACGSPQCRSQRGPESEAVTALRWRETALAIWPSVLAVPQPVFEAVGEAGPAAAWVQAWRARGPLAEHLAY